jgi:outer membrane protein OmpA-like peptidoglycan-associated protein
MRNPFRLTVLASALVAAGCAVSPQAHQQLEEARAAYRLAADDPNVRQYAQAELNSAEAALRDAERKADESKYSELVEHNAYLAAQRARVAQNTAEVRKTEVDIQAAREERRRNQLEAREREAREREAAARDEAQRAESARREAEMRARLLEEEKANNEREKIAAAELGAEVKRLETELADVRAQQTERGWILTLKNDLLFDSGGATLKPGAERALDNLAQFMQKYPDRAVAIEGFTDSTGSKEVNQQLSEKRAWAVKAALVKRGISSTRVDARGYGPSFPVASNANETGRQLNRRVEVVIN